MDGDVCLPMFTAIGDEVGGDSSSELWYFSPMKRVHTLEFEDLPWFPDWLRGPMTNNIVVMGRWLGVPSAVAGLLGKMIKALGTSSVVDLGSGGGGSMPEVIERMREEGGSPDLKLTLTDKYPNADALASLNDSARPHIRYLETSVDATSIGSAPEGIKTMVNCFHPMRPDEARSILKSAFDKREPILIYEMGGDKLAPFPLWLLTLPIGLSIVAFLAFIKSALVRPFTFRQFFFTYVIPLVPIFYAWDGQASMPRIYRFEDLDELLEGLSADDYVWEKGYGDNNGRKAGSYLMGMPRVGDKNVE